jgi:antitoxin StbD|uniref:type II toxin-antitoxin system Phd/YefM family antitoxin n=1 Tax=Polynucleobacter sp. TaxID=2029855 RepID=UPI0040472C4D
MKHSRISISNLRKNLNDIIEQLRSYPVAIYSCKRPVAYILSAKSYETLLERLDDVDLTELAKSRLQGKRVQVDLSTL